MHYFHLCRNVEQYSAITYHGFCVGMGLMYVTLPRNIMQRFSKHSVLMLLKYPRVSQHLIAWNILAQNSSKQNFMGRVIMLSWKKKKLSFFNLLAIISSIFVPSCKGKQTFLKARSFFGSHFVLIPYSLCLLLGLTHLLCASRSFPEDFCVFLQWNWNAECFSSPDFCLQLPECFVLGTSHSNCWGCYIWFLLYMQKLCPWIYRLHNSSYCVCMPEWFWLYSLFSEDRNIKEHTALQWQEWRTPKIA